MDKEVLDIVMQMIYNDKINEMYENRSTQIDFPIKITTELNFKVLVDFNNNYFNKYQYILLNNALTYALKQNNKDYLNFIKENIDRLKEYLETEMMFRIKTIELAYKNLINKFYENKYKDEEIIEQNKDFYEKINKIFTKKEFITQIYRKIIFEFINSTDEDKEELLDHFLSTDYFDNDVITLSENFIEKNSINNFKKIIVRLILFDTYLHIQSLYMEEEIDKHINNIYKKYHNEGYDENTYYDEDLDTDDFDEEDFEMLNEENDMKILEYIDYCIQNNRFELPSDETTRMNILAKFLTYNVYSDKNGRNYDIETIEQDTEKKLTLKKINPLYKLETIDFNEM